MAAPPNIWQISADDRSKHDQQFVGLKPVNGFITGEQARGFFLKSGLPSNVLAQIWNLADVNKDGKMDRREFSIAMHLIQKKLQGFALPQTLPESLYRDPQPIMGSFVPQQPLMSTGMMQPTGMVHGFAQMPVGAVRPSGLMNPMPVGFPSTTGPLPMGPFPSQGTPPLVGSPKFSGPLTMAPPPQKSVHSVDWSMPPATKLKYSQMFNTLDKSRIGSLSGVHARNIMSQSGLPHAVLGQVWNLSDLDKDGKLTCDEFCIAMHLMEMLKQGEPLPTSTPPELTMNLRSRTLSLNSTGSGPTVGIDGELAAGVAGIDLLEDDRLSAVSFEDKRRQNYDRGQAELHRRRQLLEEQERREREERERKEREIADRRERERLEQERKRQMEIEKELVKQRELEQVREEERRRQMEQREAARRELESQRQAEIERIKLQELRQQHLRDQESVCHLKQKQKNLTFQVQALNESANDLNGQIGDIRQKMMLITESIERMRTQRDEKTKSIHAIHFNFQETNQRLGAVTSEKTGLVARQTGLGSGGSQVNEAVRQVKHSYRSKEMNIEHLKATQAECEGKLKELMMGSNGKSDRIETLRNEINQAKQEQQALIGQINQKQNNLHASRGTKPAKGQQPFNGITSSHGDAGFQQNAEGARVAKYKALYEFAAQNDDELTFQPGDVILVFLDHVTEPGWLAGQFQGKVGWFPSAYAECIEPPGTVSTSPTKAEVNLSPTNQVPVAQVAGGHVRVLDGINEESSSFDQENGVAFPAAAKVDVSNGHPIEGDFSLERSRTSDSIASSHHSKASTVREVGAPEDVESRKGSASFEMTGEPLQAQAQYPWKAKKDDQLTFAKGDLIRIIQQDEMWWKGQLNGKEGWFPKSYVKLKTGPWRKTSSKAGTPTDEQPSTPVVLRPSAELYVAMYPFVTSEPGDLEFQAGDHITVVSKDGVWWTGQIGDRQGIFPANYVNKADETVTAVETTSDTRSLNRASSLCGSTTSSASTEMQYEVAQAIAPFAPTTTNQLSLNPGDLVKVRAKSPNGWWEGELNRPGQEKRAGWFPGHFVKVLTAAQQEAAASGKKESLSAKNSIASATGSTATAEFGTDANKNPLQPPSNNEDWVVATFDYTPQQDDELFLTAGTQIRVIDRENDAWWRGVTLAGQEGVFPANYVEPATVPPSTAGATPLAVGKDPAFSAAAPGDLPSNYSDDHLDLR